jgi:hypothetical protein
MWPFRYSLEAGIESITYATSEARLISSIGWCCTHYTSPSALIKPFVDETPYGTPFVAHQIQRKYPFPGPKVFGLVAH